MAASDDGTGGPGVLREGETFAGYRIEAVIGRGGMGVVYKARDPSLDRPVALKIVAPELAGDPRFRERFLRETRLAVALEHPHVLPVLAAGERDGVLFLATRYVEGEDLEGCLAREGKLAPERALRIVGEMAEALDAAHGKGLVHRDVKPGNVLLDTSGEAYLADFGLAKQASSQSGLTATGQLVGTLDYLAPEQIRAEDVKGPADQYALACVLYECLAGEPPFRHESPPQTLWAHLQEPPPPLTSTRPELPAAIDAVMGKALAKEPGRRFATCAEFVAAARRVLGIGVEVRRAPLLPTAVRRRGKLIALVGALLVTGALAAVIVQVTREPEPSGLSSVAPNSVAVIDPATNEIVAAVPVGRNPTSIAVGEEAVWVLNADDRTISRIDPVTKEERRFGTGTVPIDIAAGEGAVWALNEAVAADPADEAVRSVTRIDPTTEATVTFELPAAGRLATPTRNPGQRHIVAGEGAVFAISAAGSIVAIDPRESSIARTIDAGIVPGGLALGDGLLWVVEENGSALVKIDAHSGDVLETYDVGTIFLGGTATGDGAIWATDFAGGTAWRIDPGGVSRTVTAGSGATAIAFGEGSAWVVSARDGTVTRVSPATNSVAATIEIGNAPRGVAVGEGAVWVTVGGAPGTDSAAAAGRAAGEAQPLPDSFCGELLYEGDPAGPQYLVVSDMPLRGGFAFWAIPIRDAIEHVLRKHGFRAGPYRVGYQSCDDSSAQSPDFDLDKCTANAKAYVANERVLGVVGALHSPCSFNQIPIANEAGLAMISPSNSDTLLTREDESTPPNVLEDLYPTGVRTYARLFPADFHQGVALALLAEELGAERVFILGEAPELDVPFRDAAERLGLRVVGGPSPWTTDGADASSLVDDVVRSRPDAVFIAGGLFGDAEGSVLRELRSRLPDRVSVLAGDGWWPAGALEAGDAAEGMYITFPGLPNSDLPPVGRQLLEQLEQAGGAAIPSYTAAYGAQAAEVLLDAIARSDGTRASVARELLATDLDASLLGDVSFDTNGDLVDAPITVLRVVGGEEAGETGFPGHEGSVVDRVITVSPELLGEVG